MHRGFSMPGVVTGKPLAIGGSAGRTDATGQGVVYTIEEAARRLGIGLAGATVAVQGFGNVGEATARLLHERGARVVASPTPAAASTPGRGLDVPVPRPRSAGARHGRRRPGHRARSTTILFGLDVDMLVLAALEGQITPRTPAGSARGSSPRAPTARPTRGRPDPARDGVTVIPDILCNAGGVIVSYFEWAQNRAALAWTRDEVNDRLRRQILADRGRRRSTRRPPTGSRRGSPPMPSPSSVSPRRPASAASTPEPS